MQLTGEEEGAQGSEVDGRLVSHGSIAASYTKSCSQCDTAQRPPALPNASSSLPWSHRPVPTSVCAPHIWAP